MCLTTHLTGQIIRLRVGFTRLPKATICCTKKFSVKISSLVQPTTTNKLTKKFRQCKPCCYLWFVCHDKSAPCAAHTQARPMMLMHLPSRLVVTLALYPGSWRHGEEPEYEAIVTHQLCKPSHWLSLIPSSLLKNGGRREPGTICGKSCRHHCLCDQRRSVDHINNMAAAQAQAIYKICSSSSRHLQLCWVSWHTLYM